MQKQVFREKSMDSFTSQESLKNYLRITSPRLWMIIVSALVLIVGFVVFALIVSRETTIQTTAVVSIYNTSPFKASVEVTIPQDSKDIVKKGMTARVNGEEFIISSFYEEIDTVISYIEVNHLPDYFEAGTYDAEIVLDAMDPIEFLLN